jgi:hypothetical protein
MKPPAPSCQKPDREHLAAYLLIALVGVLAGFILGQLIRKAPEASRVDWPPRPTNPRSLNP